MKSLGDKQVGDEISLYIYYHQTERQPKPVLIGFLLEAEREFFQQFIRVEDIGPMKAVKALSIAIPEIAGAIESRDVSRLKRLKGIGPRTAQKIIAALEGKMGKFALIRQTAEHPVVEIDLVEQVLEVLVTQLGHNHREAKQMIEHALERNPSMSTSEELFEEVYRSEQAK